MHIAWEKYQNGSKATESFPLTHVNFITADNYIIMFWLVLDTIFENMFYKWCLFNTCIWIFVAWKQKRFILKSLRVYYQFLHMFKWGLGFWVATFREIAPHSVYHMFVILGISRFGFDGWILVLIATVTGLCILRLGITPDTKVKVSVQQRTGIYHWPL